MKDDKESFKSDGATVLTSSIDKPTIRFGNFTVPKWIFFSMMAVFLYGLMGVVAKFATNDIPPLMVLVLSTMGMTPIIIIILFSKNIRTGTGKFGTGIVIGILVGTITAAATISQYMAFSFGGPASIVVPIISLASVVTVVLAFFIYKDKLSSLQWFGVVLSMFAILLFNINAEDTSTPLAGSLSDAIISPWMLFALLGLFAAGTAQLMIKTATNHISADLVTFIVIAVYVVLSLILIVTQNFSWDISLRNVLTCLSVGVLGSLAFRVQSVAYATGSAAVVAPLCSLFPVITVLLAVPLLGERMTVVTVVAIVLATVAGVALSIERKSKSPEI